MSLLFGLHLVYIWSTFGVPLMMNWFYLILGLAAIANSLEMVDVMKSSNSLNRAYFSFDRLILLVVIFLLFTLSTALIYLLLDFYFLGLASIIVYCGAIAIIFLFVIMMVNQQFSVPLLNKPSSFLLCFKLIYIYIYVILIITAITAVLLISASHYFYWNRVSCYCYIYPVVSSLIFTSTGIDVYNFASVIYVAYPIALFIIGISLWIVMVGIINMLTPDVVSVQFIY